MQTGTIIYWPSPEMKIPYYYEYRRNQKHCFFVDLYMWSGIDSQTGKACFTSMYPPSTTPTKNLAGIMNIFSAAMLNRRANKKDVVAITGKKGKDLKNPSSNKRKFKLYSGIADKNITDLEPGSKESPGLWVDTHIQFFREDQPYEAWQGPGGMDKWNEWKNNEGSNNDYVYSRQPRGGGSEDDMMHRWMRYNVFPMMRSTLYETRRNLTRGVGRVSGGKQYYRPSEIDKLISSAKSGAAPFGWNQEYFAAINENDLKDYNSIQYVSDPNNKLEAIRKKWKDATGGGAKTLLFGGTSEAI